MHLPPPSANQAYWDISAIDSGHIGGVLLGVLMDTVKDDGRGDLPCLAFLLRHSRTGDPFLFDLGIRPDVENLGDVLNLVSQMDMKLEGRDIPATLEKGGLSRADVRHILISHIHFDHSGFPPAFPNAMFLVGAGSKPILETQGPNFEGTMYSIDLPLERTTFLDPSGSTDTTGADWAPIGPFPRALDFYGDGSLYIVDAPGHMPGHLNVLVRTSPDGGWAFLAGDSAHDWQLLTGEAMVGHHHTFGCIHEDPAKAQETIERVKALSEHPRVRVLLAHDVPFVNANAADATGYWPDTVESL
uniref:MFS domain-containing protein n=1 Tax=Ganoderma boninense TaxID=34458 RepID=A0A5K1K6N0_9APHY|nr:MFS domain-containing protein [Ganoderma boninense]